MLARLLLVALALPIAARAQPARPPIPPSGTGCLIGNCQDSYGAFRNPSGDAYAGDFIAGSPHGRGVYTWPDGQRYEGEFRNGNRNGHGVSTWLDGQRYEGEYRDGKQNGRGVYTWPDGQRHEGEYRDGTQNGPGVYTWPNGERHEGEFRGGKPTGPGVRTFPNGTRYEGAFADWKRDGVFTVTDTSGRVQQERFRDDVFVEVVRGTTPAPAPAPAPRSGTLAVGATVAGALGGQSPLPALGERGPRRADDYTLVLRAGQTVTVRMTSSAFDTYLVVLLGGAVVVENDDAGSTRASEVTLTASAAGTYTVRATAWAVTATGDYTLSATAAGTAPTPQPGSLAVGAAVEGALTSTDPEPALDSRGPRRADDYTLVLSAGQTVTVDVLSFEFDTYLVVLRDGAIVAENDDYPNLGLGMVETSEVTITAATAGTYTVRVTAWDEAAAGDYTLSTTAAGTAPTPPPGSLAVGATVEGALTSTDAEPALGSHGPRRADDYALALRADERVTVRLAADAFDTYLVVLFDDFVVVENDDAGSTRTSEVTLTARTAGTYTVRATAWGEAAAGEYTLSATAAGTAPTPPPGSLAVGTVTSGALTSTDAEPALGSRGPRRADDYTLELRAGQTVSVRMTSPFEFDTYLVVLRDGAIVAENDDYDLFGLGNNSKVTITATTAGTYTVRATALHEAAAGRYWLRVAAGTDDSSLAVGAVVSGALADTDVAPALGTRGPRRADDYTLALRAGQSVTVRMEGMGFDTYLVLLRDDAVVGQNDDAGSTAASEIAFTAPTAGTYTVRATAYAEGAAGAYTLTVR